jgi:hypothetical protein
MDQYTHRFTFKVGDDSGKFIDGKVEFDTDHKMTFKITNISEPLQQEVLQSFTDLMDHLHKLYDSFGGIQEIKIVKL